MKLAFKRQALEMIVLKLKNITNFQPLEVVSRYRDPQLQVVENLKYFIDRFSG